MTLLFRTTLFLLSCSSLTFAAGRFFPVAVYPVPNKPIYVAAADFNGDGILDLATSSENHWGEAVYSILLGNGDGTFRTAVTYSGGGSRGIAVADLNGDGKMDLVTNNSGVVAVLLGDGDGTFQNAFFYGVTTTSYGVATADFNADGKVDVVIPDDYRGGVDVLLGNGDGTLQAPILNGFFGAYPADVIVGDFNGDKKVDVATDDFGGTIGVALGNGDGTFRAGINLSTGPSSSNVVAADFNHDGKLDLLVATVGAEIIFFPGNGDGTFGSRIQSSFKVQNPFIAGIGDFDHNGQLDIAVADSRKKKIEIALGVGDGTFRDGGPYFVNGSDLLGGTVADFNGDGWADVVVPAFTTQQIFVLINVGKNRN